MAWLMLTGSALNQLVQFLVPQSLSKHFTPLALIPVHKPKPRFSPNADSRSGFEVLALKKQSVEFCEILFSHSYRKTLTNILPFCST